MGLLVDVLRHPEEVPALWRYYRSSRRDETRPPNERGSHGPTREDRDDDDFTTRKCYDFLKRTSRSFAAVIRALHPELRMSVCVFYLVLRGLDTVEDDVSIPKIRKCEVLRSFHETIYQKGWSFHENRESEKDAFLLREFSVVIDAFLLLKPKYRKVIEDITRRMGSGMAEFCLSEKQGDVATVEEYNLYCHYVAGLVGIGLSKLFSFSGLESEKLALKEDLSKVNITRDYLEDVSDDRCWWPKEIWGPYAEKLSDFALPENEDKAVQVLNRLCIDALSLVPVSLEYLSSLREPTVFHFCAIPQVMAVTTLALLFNNPAVFRRKGVKIRKGQAVSCLEKAQTMEGVLELYEGEINHLGAKNVDARAPTFLEVALLCGKLKQTIAEHRERLPKHCGDSMKKRSFVEESHFLSTPHVAILVLLISAVCSRWFGYL